MPPPGDQHKGTSASANPFLPSETRISQYTAQEIATLQSRLDRQLGPEFISTRSGAGGGKVHYLAGEKAINLANDVFGFNGWSSSIQNVQIDFVDENTASGKISLGLSVIMRITLRDGTYHEDIGYGHIENCKGKAAAFEKSKKEAATDALKRALRNFGNVLGNCLYDKDYLQRVTKLKAGPSKWDSNHLHRHPDFVPREPHNIENNTVAKDQRHASNQSRTLARNTSLQSAGSADFEDDYGGDLFDETDLSHPEEIRLDDSTNPVETPAKKAQPGSVPQATRQVPQRLQSMPQLRQNGPQTASAQGLPSPLQRPQPKQAPQNAPSNGARVMPSNVQGQPQRLPPHTNTGPAWGQLDGQAGRSNPSSDATIADSSGNHPQSRGTIALPGPVNDVSPPDAQPIPAGAPQGFVAARGAEFVNQVTAGAKAAPPNLDFNPHKESPSIRKTHGVNPGRSAPVRRESTQQPTYDIPLSQGQPNGQNHVVRPNNPQNNNFRPQSPANRPPNNTTPSNFVNPSADPARKIGMPPPPGGGGMQTRGQYRPPTAVKRPALADVSNMQQAEGDEPISAGTKKQKVDHAVSVDPGGNDGGQNKAIAAT